MAIGSSDATGLLSGQLIVRFHGGVCQVTAGRSQPAGRMPGRYTLAYPYALKSICDRHLPVNPSFVYCSSQPPHDDSVLRSQARVDVSRRRCIACCCSTTTTPIVFVVGVLQQIVHDDDRHLRHVAGVVRAGTCGVMFTRRSCGLPKWLGWSTSRHNTGIPSVRWNLNSLRSSGIRPWHCNSPG